MTSPLKTLAICALAASTLSAPPRAEAGIITKTEAVVFTGAVSILTLATLYKQRCVAGGGTFSADGEFRSFGSGPAGIDAFQLVCPQNTEHPPPFRYSGLAMELEPDLALFKSTDKLRANMKAKGKGANPSGCAAHHIVPEDDDKGSDSKPTASDAARGLLRRCDISINDADNGVFLPNKKDEGESQCKGAYHRKLHTKMYYLMVKTTLTTAFAQEGCKGVREALQELGDDLASGPRIRSWSDAVPEGSPSSGAEASGELGSSALPSDPPGGLR
jgi:hypothetical protein